MGEQKKQKTLTQSAFSHKTINPRQQESKQAKQLAEKHTSDSRTEQITAPDISIPWLATQYGTTFSFVKSCNSWSSGLH